MFINPFYRGRTINYYREILAFANANTRVYYSPSMSVLAEVLDSPNFREVLHRVVFL